jgi:hypothetical protein
MGIASKRRDRTVEGNTTQHRSLCLSSAAINEQNNVQRDNHAITARPSLSVMTPEDIALSKPVFDVSIGTSWTIGLPTMEASNAQVSETGVGRRVLLPSAAPAKIAVQQSYDVRMAVVFDIL